MAEECEIDPSDFNKDMQSFFDKRSLGDAIMNENKNVCSIATRTMKFLKSDPGEVDTKPCNHFSSEEDD